MTQEEKTKLGDILGTIVNSLFPFMAVVIPTQVGNSFGEDCIEKLCNTYPEELGKAEDFIGKGAQINDNQDKCKLREQFFADVNKMFKRVQRFTNVRAYNNERLFVKSTTNRVTFITRREK